MYKKLGAKNVLAFRARGGFIKVMLLIANYSHWAVLIPYVVTKMINSVASICTMLHWNSASQSLKRLVVYCSLISVMHGMHQMYLWYNSKKTFNYGVGAGVRITTPIGPVKLDYGVGKHKNKFHFSFGTQF